MAKASPHLDDYGDLLKVTEYAAIARRGKRQAYEDVRLGRITSIRLGTAIRIPKAAIEQKLAEAAEARA